jgi:hypothetical protein
MRLVFAGVMCAVASVFIEITPAVGATGAEDRIPALEAGTSAVDVCTAAFAEDAFGKTPSEGTVVPGQRFSVDVTWRTAWHEDPTVDVVGCVASNGRFAAAGSTLARGVENNGLYVHQFTVPEDSAKDATICEAAVIVGQAHGGDVQAERSGPDCFTVATASRAAAGIQPAAGASKQTTAPSEGGPPAAQGSPEAPSGADGANAAQAHSQASPVVPPSTTEPPSAAPQAPAPSTSAARPAELGRTGRGDRILTALAGLMFVLGGFTIGLGASQRELKRRRGGAV